jgi:MFS superfamily sulfate permease-like transporter
MMTIDDTPRGTASGFRRYFRDDILSGFLVFLIALPLCLGISLASGYPPLAGIFTAIIGSIVTTFISNSELTIKGPAAGLIVIVLGCIEEFGGDGMSGGWTDADALAYRSALAVGVAAAVLQVLFGIFRAGILGEFFPVSAVHGMLAAIGVIIISKQVPVALGIQAKGEPLELISRIPEFIGQANPAIAAIGITSIAIMFLWPMIGKRAHVLKFIPGPLVVLLVTIPMGIYFDLLHKHSYVLQNHEYQLGDQYLVAMPDHIFGMFENLTLPYFPALASAVAWKWVLMFFIIGTLESLLSARAVDIIDPYKRKTNLDRDVVGVGLANMLASFVGGLPMISEIVRSRANIDNGAKTRFADMWHGAFLLVCVALIPTFLHRIPLAALAGMLVYTGFRLAHPNEFMNVYRIGREQLIIFVTTIIAVLATDLLIGIAIGIAVKMMIHLINGVPISSMFKAYLDVEQQDEQTTIIRAHKSAVFSNWIPFRRQIEEIGLVQKQNIVLDLSNTHLVDHSVMDKLHEMEGEFLRQGLKFTIIGLESHQALASHDHAARKRSMAMHRRVTVVGPASIEERITHEVNAHGAYVLSVIDQDLVSGQFKESDHQVRMEIIASKQAMEGLVPFFRQGLPPELKITVCVEIVDVLRMGSSLADQVLQNTQDHSRRGL